MQFVGSYFHTFIAFYSKEGIILNTWFAELTCPDWPILRWMTSMETQELNQWCWCCQYLQVSQDGVFGEEEIHSPEEHFSCWPEVSGSQDWCWTLSQCSPHSTSGLSWLSWVFEDCWWQRWQELEGLKLPGFFSVVQDCCSQDVFFVIEENWFWNVSQDLENDLQDVDDCLWVPPPFCQSRLASLAILLFPHCCLGSCKNKIHLRISYYCQFCWEDHVLKNHLICYFCNHFSG